ncbi:MAG: FAD-dependent monooxygenase [Pseudomonadota bacterium]
MNIVIAGAGIGGLTTAIALAQKGHDVQVYEQAPQLGEVGAGITITPNSDRVFTALGLGGALAPHIVVPERQLTQHWQTGAVIKDVERGEVTARRYGAGYYHIHRADLHQVLADAFLALVPGGIVLGSPAQAASPDGTLTLVDGTAHHADLIIGADGLKSRVRESAFTTSAPEFTGQVAWRGLVPIERVDPAARMDMPGIHIGPKQLFMRYPVRGGKLMNYAAFVDVGGWAEEGWTIPSSQAELLGYFGAWDSAVTALIEATPDDELFKWALNVRKPLESWIAGKVTLIGDAAHAMLPFMGQGAATAIEDAMVLARSITDHDVAEGLQRYDRARRPRTDAIQENSRLLGLQFQGKDPASVTAGRIKNEEELGLFEYDAVTTDI